MVVSRLVSFAFCVVVILATVAKGQNLQRFGSGCVSCAPNAHCQPTYIYDQLTYRCQCLPGWEGDGITYCGRPIGGRNDLSNSLYLACTLSCGINGYCRRRRRPRYLPPSCICHSGYRRRNNRCVPRRNPCRNHDCHRDAICIPYYGRRPRGGRRYDCKCKRNYRGNGRRCRSRRGRRGGRGRGRP